MCSPAAAKRCFSKSTVHNNLCLAAEGAGGGWLVMVGYVFSGTFDVSACGG
jgi:hypothetical protein